jgi:hypothetical protein
MALLRWSSLGPRPQREGCYVGRVERNLHWVTDGLRGLDRLEQRSRPTSPGHAAKEPDPTYASRRDSPSARGRQRLACTI